MRDSSPRQPLERLETLAAKDLVNDKEARQTVLGLKKKPVFKVSKIFEQYEVETKDQVLGNLRNRPLNPPSGLRTGPDNETSIECTLI
jgi:hypothetical protein